MNSLSIFSSAWLNKLKTIFGKTKFQKKFLSADKGPLAPYDESELSFNNLTVGKAYRVSGVFAQAISNNTNIFRWRSGASASGTVYGTVTFSGNPLVLGLGHIAYSFTFTAVSPTLILRVANLDGTLGGDGTVERTHAMLEELPNHEETTQWT